MEHVLKFSDQQLSVIGAALAELPFKIAQPILAAIQQQIDEAAAKATDPKKKES